MTELSELNNAEIAALIGERVSAWRKLRELRQEDLAEQAGVGVSTLARLESGKNCSILNLISILRALGKLDWLAAVSNDTAVSPVQMVKIKAKEKLRVRQKRGDSGMDNASITPSSKMKYTSHSNAETNKPDQAHPDKASGWTWGDET